ncbi:unnamed protein product [Caenorhabditis nigoni]
MLPTRTNTFEFEEPNTKTKIWYQWINNHIRQYMILEIFYIISLVLILYRLQTLSNQNDRVLEMVNSMHSQFGNMERKLEALVSQTPNQGISPINNSEPLEQSIPDVLKARKFPTQDSTEKTESIIPQMKQSTFQTEDSILKVPNPKEPTTPTTTPAKIEEKHLESAETCADLKWYYHSFKSTFTRQNCTVLYENNCCSECPECCQQCLTPFYKKTKNTVESTILCILALIVLCIIIYGISVIIVECIKLIRKFLSFLAQFLIKFFSKLRGLNLSNVHEQHNIT